MRPIIQRQDAVAPLARDVERELPRLVEMVTASIRREIDFYRSVDVIGDADLRRSTETNLVAFLAALSGQQPPDFIQPTATGHQRAQQGAPLVEVQRAFRLGYAAVWTVMSEHAEDEGTERLRA